MVERLLSLGFQYAGYALELSLLAYLVWRREWRRLAVVWIYVFLLFAIDGVGRPYVLYRFGLESRQYFYFFWLTDVLLALAAFLVVCAFFRRACAGEEKLWRFTRLMLAFVFFLVPGISLFSLSQHYDGLLQGFIYEFGQNLYFTCLVLNTLLYLLMQQIESADDQLGLLVCGLGIQFAGPAASLALLHLTSGQAYARVLNDMVWPLCTLGMLVTWLFAVWRAEKPAAEFTFAGAGGKPRLAEVPVSGTK